jgi:hypothetical protein
MVRERFAVPRCKTRLRALALSDLSGDLVDLVGIEPTTSSMPLARIKKSNNLQRPEDRLLGFCTRNTGKHHR